MPKGRKCILPDEHNSKVVDRFVAAAQRERDAIGYPDLTRKISYSSRVRELAREAIHLPDVSISYLSRMSGVSYITLQKWSGKLSVTTSPEFRELRIVPDIGASEIPSIKNNPQIHHRNTPEASEKKPVTLEVTLPWGILLTVRQDAGSGVSLGLFWQGGRKQ